MYLCSTWLKLSLVILLLQSQLIYNLGTKILKIDKKMTSLWHQECVKPINWVIYQAKIRGKEITTH